MRYSPWDQKELDTTETEHVHTVAKSHLGDFPGSLWLRLHAFKARAAGSIPRLGTKILARRTA